MQATLLGVRSFDARWTKRLCTFFASIWDPARYSENIAATYMAFSPHCTCWYVGKADVRRTGNSLVWPGLVMRCREHLTTLVRRTGDQSHRPRYRQWRDIDVYNLFFLPGAYTERNIIFAFEQMVISCLQAPTQQWHSRRAPLEQRGARPYPRFRRLPTVARESSN